MADIDVSEILGDPDFVDKMVIIKRKPVINSHGENTLQETVINSAGCIQAASGNVISRLPEEFRVANVMSFWFRGELTSSDQRKGKYADLISFKNKVYQIQLVWDWTNWGQGWSEGTCIYERPA